MFKQMFEHMFLDWSQCLDIFFCKWPLMTEKSWFFSVFKDIKDIIY